MFSIPVGDYRIRETIADMRNTSGGISEAALRVFVRQAIETEQERDNLQLQNRSAAVDVKATYAEGVTQGAEVTRRSSSETISVLMSSSFWWRVFPIFLLMLLLVVASFGVGYFIHNPVIAAPAPAASAQSPTTCSSTAIVPVDSLSINSNSGKVQTIFHAGDVLYISAQKASFVLHHMVFTGHGHGYTWDSRPFSFTVPVVFAWVMSAGDYVTDLAVKGGGTLSVVYHVGQSSDLSTYGSALLRWADSQYPTGYTVVRNTGFVC